MTSVSVRGWAQQLHQRILARYIGASLVSLMADVAVFWTFITLGVGAALASAFGYCFGIAVHWVISSRAVFTRSVAPHGRDRTRQKTLFALSALLGLALTTAIVGAGEQLGSHALVSKSIAVIVGFCAVYLLRKQIIFR